MEKWFTKSQEVRSWGDACSLMGELVEMGIRQFTVARRIGGWTVSWPPIRAEEKKRA